MESLYSRTIEALEKSLNCAMIASEIDVAEGVFRADEPPSTVRRFAISHHYSQVPLGSERSGSPPAITHVALLAKGPPRTLKRRRIKPEDLLAGSTSIGRAIHLLQLRSFFFVLEEDRITRIITRSDLNRLPVRTYLHTLLDHLEALLVDVVVNIHPNDTWMQLMSDNRRKKTRELHERKRSDDLETELIDCTTFSDKLTIIEKSCHFPPERLGHPSRSSMRDSLGRVRKLRDLLSHSGDLVEFGFDDLRNRVRHVDKLSRRRDVEWLSRVVQTLQEAIAVLEREP